MEPEELTPAVWQGLEGRDWTSMRLANGTIVILKPGDTLWSVEREDGWHTPVAWQPKALH